MCTLSVSLSDYLLWGKPALMLWAAHDWGLQPKAMQVIFKVHPSAPVKLSNDRTVTQQLGCILRRTRGFLRNSVWLHIGCFKSLGLWRGCNLKVIFYIVTDNEYTSSMALIHAVSQNLISLLPQACPICCIYISWSKLINVGVLTSFVLTRWHGISRTSLQAQSGPANTLCHWIVRLSFNDIITLLKVLLVGRHHTVTIMWTLILVINKR